MSQQTKPSAGALRAADKLCKDIVKELQMADRYSHQWFPSPKRIAYIIDRETGVAELLEAAKLALLTQYYEATTHIDAMRKLEQAIAKAEPK